MNQGNRESPHKQKNRQDSIDKTGKIAIIGAGISGLTAARALKERGYTNVTVFEKESHVGGKIHTVTFRGRVYETGALVASHRFKRVMAAARSFGETLTRAEEAYLVDANGEVSSYRQFIKKNIGWGTFFASVARFMRVVTEDRELRQAGFASVDRRLFMPMKDFSVLKDIDCATRMIQPFLVGCGFGYYESVPAMYLMKLAPWVLEQPFLDSLSFGSSRGWSTFDQGWQDLLRRMAEGLDIRLATAVTAVQRKSNLEHHAVELELGEKREVFDSLIVTTPPDGMLRMLDVTPEESRLFRKVKYVRYVVTLVEGTHLFTVHFLPHVHPHAIGHINCIVREHDDTDIFQVYQMLPEDMSLAQALDIAESDIRLLHGAITRVIDQKEWRYFPHVGPSDLEQGFYQDLERLQGDRHTYFLGGLLNFETVEHNTAYAEALVERFF